MLFWSAGTVAALPVMVMDAPCILGIANKVWSACTSLQVHPVYITVVVASAIVYTDILY